MKPPKLPRIDTSLEELHRLIAHAIGTVGEDHMLAYLGVHRTTLYRWRSGESRVPAAAISLLRVWADGRLPGMDENWRGFQFRGNTLRTAAGYEYTALEIENWHWKEQRIRMQEDRVKQLEAIILAMAEKANAQRETANDPFVHDPTRPTPKPRPAA